MPRILVLDDEDMIRMALADYLEDSGCDVTTAATGEEALQHLQHLEFDIAIIDIRLPGTDGNELIQKAFAANRDMKFLIHTGSIDYILPGELARLGVAPEDIFIKPVADMAAIFATVRRLTGHA